MEINKTTQQDVVICSISGDIDINSSPEIRKEFEELVTQQQKKILINLSDVSYIDSSGLATLVEMLKRTKSYNGSLKISNLADKVKGLFEITKLDKIFDIHNTVEEAIAKFT